MIRCALVFVLTAALSTGLRAESGQTKDPRTEPETAVKEAIRLLERSLAVDPGFARAWVGLFWARYTLSGYATFYDNGRTAMRLPYGTVVIICGGGGCVQRVISDYGPSAANPERIVDLYRPDFFRICGCPSWSGTTRVTVRVY